MKLTGEQARRLKAQAQSLKPSVQIGRNGLTDAQIDKIKHELEHHELIKVKFNEYKDQKRELSDEIASRTGAEKVGLVGNTLILYKRRSRDG